MPDRKHIFVGQAGARRRTNGDAGARQYRPSTWTIDWPDYLTLQLPRSQAFSLLNELIRSLERSDDLVTASLFGELTSTEEVHGEDPR